MKRRDFLKYIGAGGVGGIAGYLFGKATKPPGAKLIPYLIPPEDIIPGVATWYAGVCAQCPAGCGIHARVMEGRVKKIEGNPEHPVNKGRLCARGQALPQALYNPDRIKGPMRRTGGRGKGDFTDISWDEAVSIVSKNLSELGSKGLEERLALLSPPLKGSLGNLVSGILKAYGAENHFECAMFDRRNLLYANKVSMGIDSIPHYDIANTKYLLSFGADFSTTYLSPVNLSHGFGQMRQGGKGRGKLVQIEPRMSLTGAVADNWVGIRPGAEGLVALSIAHTIVESGFYRSGDVASWRAALKRFSPEEVSKASDVPEETIHGIAKEFITKRPSLAIAGDTVESYVGGAGALVAINILNHVAGNLNRPGGVIANPDRERDGRKMGMAPLLNNALNSKINTLIICNSNPVYASPNAMKAREALNNIPFIVSLGSFMDETAEMADLVLPVHTSLEDWADDYAEPSVGYPVSTVSQPAVKPIHNTMGIGDVFISIAKGIGGKTAASVKAEGFKDYLKDAWRGRYLKNKDMGSSAISFEDFWRALLKNGGWWPKKEPVNKASGISSGAVASYVAEKPLAFEGNESEYPFYLLLYPQAGHFDGSGANSPWLQELPDPMTSVVWGNWVEINPSTAKALGIKTGDLLIIQSPYGEVLAPAYVYAGIRPDVVAMPIGQGHSSYGRYAKNRDSNPIEILPASSDSRTGAIALNSTRVKVKKAYRQADLVRMEGSTRELGRDIVKTISVEDFERIKG